MHQARNIQAEDRFQAALAPQPQSPPSLPLHRRAAVRVGEDSIPWLAHELAQMLPKI